MKWFLLVQLQVTPIETLLRDVIANLTWYCCQLECGRAGSDKFECKIKKFNGNFDIQMVCKKDDKFKKDFQDSLKPAKEHLEDA